MKKRQKMTKIRKWERIKRFEPADWWAGSTSTGNRINCGSMLKKIEKWKRFLYLKKNVFLISSWTLWFFQSIVNIFLSLSSAATRIRQTEFFQPSAYESDWKHKKAEFWFKKSATEIRNTENEKWWKSFQLHFFS